ncbi:glycosyltransferase [Candidatus Roizmanbacteria bacterium]|nr:glycosyltransferase [Candidatus Roizmanbacteria bacterium]
MKIAIVHDQLQEFGGAERVIVALKKIYPDADVYTSFYNPEALGVHRHAFEGWNIKSSWADTVPLLKKLYSPLRCITPLIWESLNLSSYDLVISSSGSYMSKGVITRPETLHVCYLHHPPRYLYNYETAIEWQKYWLILVYGNIINHDLRKWDYLSSQRVDYFIANSHETASRIQKFYRRESEVIYPPVSIPNKTNHYPLTTKHYYLTISRLARAKHIDLLVHAANHHGFQLKIVGIGRDEKYLRSIAGSTVELLGSVSDRELNELYDGARAFLFASVDEEFGIAPVEAMGYGVPVIAYASGGLKETVQDGVNGFLYQNLQKESLIEKVKMLEAMNNNEYEKLSKQTRKSAEKYSEKRFAEQIKKFISSKLQTNI